MDSENNIAVGSSKQCHITAGSKEENAQHKARAPLETIVPSESLRRENQIYCEFTGTYYETKKIPWVLL
jgi:hypothetical protein